ncbi:hypothetical protein DRI96_06725 [Candidatus Aerophobetes bacterium]|uniref:Transcriptional repressor n=1 Tax=Aerophobetes bacterium TaxID=2030807 RepID=A0A662D9F1_UNCAE|nr:MAG: hypothetical protein DRI96_06725 [Candidatus Aerophobetes bacterium]
MNTNLETFKNLLKEKGIKPTYQRIIILKYLKKSREHPTIEMIYNDLVEEIPTMSRTTVYNTLNIFLEKGLVIPVTIPGLEMRFDGNLQWHHHFLCERCGRIIDLNIKCDYFEKGEVNGHRIKELHCYFKGICRDCLRELKGDDKENKSSG